MSEKPPLLIVDDDPLISDALSHAFAQDFDCDPRKAIAFNGSSPRDTLFLNDHRLEIRQRS